MNRDEEAQLVAAARIRDWARSRRVTPNEMARLIHAASRPGFLDSLPQRPEASAYAESLRAALRQIKTTADPGELPASRLKQPRR